MNIDREVAEKVMGWVAIPHSDKAFFDTDGTGLNNVCVDPSGGRTNRVFFNPSTDIAQAFQVVEKMRERGWWFECGTRLGGGWYAEFGHGGDYPYGAEADTPAEAICLAALEAAKED